MNQNHPSSEDRTRFEDNGTDAQRLNEIEQRLKAAKPRPAGLDAEAIVRAARTMVALPGPSVEHPSSPS